jgi:hypothetical protein
MTAPSLRNDKNVETGMDIAAGAISAFIVVGVIVELIGVFIILRETDIALHQAALMMLGPAIAAAFLASRNRWVRQTAVWFFPWT